LKVHVFLRNGYISDYLLHRIGTKAQITNPTQILRNSYFRKMCLPFDMSDNGVYDYDLKFEYCNPVNKTINVANVKIFDQVVVSGISTDLKNGLMD